jgi:hypothetical protein
MINLDLPADVMWVPADQVPETGDNAPSKQATGQSRFQPQIGAGLRIEIL